MKKVTRREKNLKKKKVAKVMAAAARKAAARPPEKILRRYAKLLRIAGGARSRSAQMMQLGAARFAEFEKLRGIVEQGKAWK